MYTNYTHPTTSVPALGGSLLGDSVEVVECLSRSVTPFMICSGEASLRITPIAGSADGPLPSSVDIFRVKDDGMTAG